MIKSANGRIEVHSIDEITLTINKLLHDDSIYAEMSQAARQLIHDKSGVVARHVHKIRQLLV